MILLLLAALADEPEVHAQIDWQAHPAMHIPWGMFGRGLTDRSLHRRTWKHQFRQTVSAHTLEDSGVRIFLAAAMAAERANNPEQARRLILKQLAYVEAFIEEHPDDYALARTPEEARHILATTDKMVIIHSIEGGHHLLWEPGDAAFWAEQGVALFTLVHLRDKEMGGAAIREGALGPMINPAGARARRRGEHRGLTEHGRTSLVALDEAGILVDLTHLSADAITDALTLTAAEDIPPVFTHARLQTVQDDSFAITEDQLVEVYRQGGMFAISLNALPIVDTPADVCPGTLEAWAWHHQSVVDVLRNRLPEILDDPEATWEALDGPSRTRLSTGWSSDWNGWTSHSRPVYGRGSCRGGWGRLHVDIKGLAHPGLLPEHWQRVQERGVDLDPMLRSAERFLQLWEQVRAEPEAPLEPAETP